MENNQQSPNQTPPAPPQNPAQDLSPHSPIPLQGPTQVPPANSPMPPQQKGLSNKLKKVLYFVASWILAILITLIQFVIGFSLSASGGGTDIVGKIILAPTMIPVSIIGFILEPFLTYLGGGDGLMIAITIAINWLLIKFALTPIVKHIYSVSNKKLRILLLSPLIVLGVGFVILVLYIASFYLY